MTAQGWAAVFANHLTRAEGFAKEYTALVEGDGVDTNEGERLCPTPARQTSLEAVCRTAHRVVLLVAALALVPSQSFGWGRDGHQVIANLAQSRLSPQARKGVAALLHGAHDPRDDPDQPERIAQAQSRGA